MLPHAVNLLFIYLVFSKQEGLSYPGFQTVSVWVSPSFHNLPHLRDPRVADIVD